MDVKNLYRSALFRIHTAYNGWKFGRDHGQGIEVMEKDWDNLIILDSCRWDVFNQYNTIEGESEPVISKASATPEFYESHFKNKQYYDTVLATPVAWAERLLEDVFYARKTPNDSGLSYIERVVNTTRPEVVLELAKESYDEHSNKRFIFHFWQPHVPYYGSKADQLRNELSQEYGISFYMDDDISTGESSEEAPDIVGNLLNAAMEGYITPDQLRTVYVENLELVIESVKSLLEYIDGKSVITADHGELLGEQTSRTLPKQYGHGIGIYEPGLRTVPWHTVPHNERREIISEDPTASESMDETEIEDTLRTLGYLE